MLLLLRRLGFSHKLHNHPRRRRMSEASSASLQAFRSDVSDNLNKILESLKLGSEFLSLQWIHQCLKILPIINNAFAKLMVEIDYPMSKWEADSMEDYLDYSINLLKLLNYVSSLITYLNQARISLSHALSHMESSPVRAMERMKEIQTGDTIKEVKASGGDEERLCTGNQKIFHEAMLTLKNTAFWVFGVVLSGLKSDVRPLIEMRSGVCVDSSLTALDSIVEKMITKEEGVLKEVKDVNETVGLIVSRGNGDSDAVKELKRRLEVLGNALKGLKDEEEDLFTKVLAARNEAIETIRTNNQ